MKGLIGGLACSAALLASLGVANEVCDLKTPAGCAQPCPPAAPQPEPPCQAVPQRVAQPVAPNCATPCPAAQPMLQPVMPQQITTFAGTVQQSAAPSAAPAIGLAWVKIKIPVLRFYAIPHREEVTVPIAQANYVAAPVAYYPQPTAAVPAAPQPIHCATPAAAAPNCSTPASDPSCAALQRAAELEKQVERLERLLQTYQQQQPRTLDEHAGAAPPRRNIDVQLRDAQSLHAPNPASPVIPVGYEEKSR